MNATYRSMARGGRRPRLPYAPIRPVHGVCLCALMLAVFQACPAAAGVLYRCTGAKGETAYVNNTHGYKHCVKVGAWTASAHLSEVADRQTMRKQRPPIASVLPGKPPRPVKANPAVLKVIPLDADDSIQVKKLVRRQAWQPFPAAVLDTLGAQVLPRLLGVETAPAIPHPLPPAAASVPAPEATAAIPLQLDTDAATPPRRGAVYRVVKKNGTVLYTNIASLTKGHDAKKLFTYIVECYACDVHSKIDWNTVPLQLAAYSDDIRAAEKLTGVNAALLRAIIHAESGFHPNALSEKGAQGLMQLMPATAFGLGVGDAFDPGQNISGGARYLATLLRDYKGDVKLAAAAYNAGEEAVAKYGGIPPYTETKVYVKRVAVLYQRYRKALAGSGSLAAAGG